MRVLVRFRAAPTEAELADVQFRYALEVARYTAAGFPDGSGWYRLRLRFAIHPVWMVAVLNKDPLVCAALPVALTADGDPVSPPSAEEAPDCVPLSTEPRERIPMNPMTVASYVDRYPWFVNVMNDLTDAAGGLVYLRLFTDGTFERALTQPIAP